jgi:hypothetical protein
VKEGSICQLEAVTSTILSTDRLLQAVVLQAKAGVLRPLSQFCFVPDEASRISSGYLSMNWIRKKKKGKFTSEAFAPEMWGDHRQTTCLARLQKLAYLHEAPVMKVIHYFLISLHRTRLRVLSSNR